jgi:hypothetical protein
MPCYVDESLVHTCSMHHRQLPVICQYIPVYTSISRYIPAYTTIYQYIRYIPVFTSIQYILFYPNIYSLIQSNTMLWYIAV